MATPTSTIRVSRATHDTLAARAHERGISLSALLAEIAEAHRKDAIWRSEREASSRDRRNPEARAEQQEWDQALGDGLG